MANTTSTSVMTPEENQARLEALKHDKKWIRKMFILLCYHITQMFTPERMLGCSMTMTMISAREDIYPGNLEKQIDLAERHAVFFNTQQGFGAIIWGIMLGMEIENARTDGGVPNDMIQAIKTALASPLAGIGDTIWQILFTPLLLSIGIGMSANGSPIGALFVFVVYCLVNIPLTYVLFSMVNVQTGLVFNVNGVTIDLMNDFFNAIYPGIPSLIVVGLTYYFVKVKRATAMQVMWAMLALSVVGYFTHILA